MEIIEEIVRSQGSRACAFPEKVNVRKVGTLDVDKELTSEFTTSFTIDGQLVSGSIKSGFSCKNDEQLNKQQCNDYEIQFCCPRKLSK